MTVDRGVISYPIPAYQNLPIDSDFYLPQRFVISAISLGLTTTVTTSTDHNYVVGQQVRLIIPSNCGSYQLNESQGYVLSIPANNQVVISIDSLRNINSFVYQSTPTQPQILAIGDINYGAINSSGRVSNITFIPGSFRNVSP